MLISALLLLSSSSMQIELGRFDPGDFPNAKKVERRVPQADLDARVDKIMSSGQCKLPGQTKTKYAVTVPYALLLDPSGKASRIVVKDIGCQPIEVLVGQIANHLTRKGDFRPTHKSGEEWYVSDAYFSRGGESLAGKSEDDDKVICEAARPKIGSRIAMQKVCRTVAEWRAFRTDRDQLRRDIVAKGQVRNE